jgi:hypothetical protein
MNQKRLVLASSLAALVLLGPHAEAAFQVLLEVDPPSGGSMTFTDDDLDGVIDFNTSVGGAFLAQGRVKQDLNPILQVLAIAPTPPAANAIFRNVDTVSRTFRVTVTSDPFPTSLTPPLGWNLFYNATVDDALSGTVNVPSHAVEGRVNAGAALVGNIVGAPIAAVTPIALQAGAVDTTNTAPDMTLVLSFTADPQDEFLVPTDDGFDGTSIQFEIFNQDQRCVDKMNNDARIVADKAWKSDFKCVRTGESSDVTACVDQPEDVPTEKKIDKLVQHFPEFCPAVPPWGVNRLACCDGGTNDGEVCSIAAPSSCAGGGICTKGLCIGAAAEGGINELTHELFGTSVLAGADAQQKCQQTILKFAGKLFTERWKVFRFCKRDSFAVILDDGDLVTTCLGQPQPDPKGKIAKRQEKLTLKVQKLCIDKGVTPVGAAFPGACTGAADNAFDDCVGQRATCAFCRAANRADAIVPPVDCDLFDDGATNASCTP